MSVPCKIEASPWRLLVRPSRVVPDGGGADEQGGTLPCRHPRARRPRRAAGGRGRLAPGAERAAGLPPAPTVRGRGCFRPRLAHRGRPSNRRLPAAVREAALAAVRERYADFGPTLAAEKLEEL